MNAQPPATKVRFLCGMLLCLAFAASVRADEPKER